VEREDVDRLLAEELLLEEDDRLLAEDLTDDELRLELDELLAGVLIDELRLGLDELLAGVLTDELLLGLEIEERRTVGVEVLEELLEVEIRFGKEDFEVEVREGAVVERPLGLVCVEEEGDL
jgi:hypothetical protein